MKTIKEMNNEMKRNVNEASGISTKCKRNLIKLVEKHFNVVLPKEDYLNVDIEVLKNGNIKMRGEEYETSSPISNIEELQSRFETFQEEVDILLEKKQTNFDTLRKKSDRKNIGIVILLTIIILVIIIDSIREIIQGNLLGVVWLGVMIGIYILPATRKYISDRYQNFWRYLKSKHRK